jgi:predicted metalloprotease with PDZ domain
MKLLKFFVCVTIFEIWALSCQGTVPSFSPLSDIRYSFTVSMENAGNHYFHIEMTCSDQHEEYIDFKMPVWTPGYYKIENMAKNVVNFEAANDNGNPLKFTKILKNTWRVDTKGQKTVTISYDVYANELFVVASYLDATKAFISPTGIFMFPDGQLNQSSLVKFKPYGNWKNISTGLDPVQNKPNTYYARDFDVLFDCPVLLGNHKVINFTVKGIPHYLAVSEKDTLDKTPFITDLTKIIETATSLIGDIPYKHYTFITIGSRGGGLEHSNSTALSYTWPVADTSDMERYKIWLAFVTHEYFHLYNVKSIRPIALGPFDYDKENYTNMLWVSEGFTVYYEYLILNRAGIFNREECLNYLSKNIAAYENRPGHLMESATLSSFDAWIHFFDPSGDARNNTISYYDKGCALGFMLDLKIRQATQNRKSLDDVMRELYAIYYKKLKRGFNDDEFRMVCEKIAGCLLPEIFEYAQTVEPIDYPKYTEIAGLSIDTAAHEVEGKVFLGASLSKEYDQFSLHNVERQSPAWTAGLGNGQQILSIDGQSVEKNLLSTILTKKQAGDTLTLSINVDDVPQSVQVVLTAEKQKKFSIGQKQNLTNLQKTILDAWLK